VTRPTLATTVVSLGICALLATGCGANRLPTAKRARANAICRRDDKVIAADELHVAFDFTAADFAAIEKEAKDLHRIGLDPRRLTETYVENAKSADLDTYQGPSVANADLEKAHAAAAKLGLQCSFGFRPALSR
jgi:hypothetical protein